MIKAVICDLDGTLLNSNKKVSNRNVQAIINCCGHGMKFVVATARPPRTVRSLLPREIYESASFIYYNGGLISDKETSFEKHFAIPKEISEEIIDYWHVHFPAANIGLEVKDRWFSNQEIIGEAYNLDEKPVVLEIAQLKTYSPTKILITEFNQLEPFKELFQDKVNITVTDQGTLIQVTNEGVSKASGVLAISDHLDIPPSEMIAFGDDFNDMEMFEIAGYSVAMDNAVDKLKLLADEVTVTNDQDGVASVLEKILSKGAM